MSDHVCKFPDGKCEVHKVWEERRKHDGELIKHIPGILSTQNRFIGGIKVISGVFALGLVVIFSYIKFIEVNAKEADSLIRTEHNLMKEGLKETNKTVYNLAIIAGKNETLSGSVLKALDELNDNLKEGNKEDGKNYFEPYRESIKR